MYYDEEGMKLKEFHVYYSTDVLLAHHYGYICWYSNWRIHLIVQRRADKLKVDYCYLGCKDKVTVASEICEKLNRQ